MNNHLSEDQFAKCFIGRGTPADLQHIAGCPECTAELDRLRASVSLFRGAIHDRIDEHVFSVEPILREPASEPVPAGVPMWRWALVVVAAVVLVVVPFLTPRPAREVIQEGTTAVDPDAVMKAVNLHLSRTVPAPMEAVMILIPKEETSQQGGDR
jgi:anti-sigma factor RsiW